MVTSAPKIKLKNSGDEEIRTLDPLLARQVLSQLSYIPVRFIMLIDITRSMAFCQYISMSNSRQNLCLV